MRWKIELQGHLYDLANCTEAAIGMGAKVEREGDKWFLHAIPFDALTTAKDVYEEAEKLLQRLQTVLSASDTGAQPLSLGPIISEDGSSSQVVKVTGTAHGRSGVFAPTVTTTPLSDVAVPPSETTLQKLARLVQSDPRVRYALELINKPDDTFGSIYKAYEIVRDELGGPKNGPPRIAALAHVSEDLLKVFYDNAHCKELSGKRARHAGIPKSKLNHSIKMPLHEAQQLIRRIVLAWIDAKN
jgi:hypothetical protein